MSSSSAEASVNDPPKKESLLADARTVAAMLGISRTTFFTMRAGGKVPKPIKLGRCVRWRIAEIEEWVQSDCPPLDRWEAMRKQLSPSRVKR